MAEAKDRMSRVIRDNLLKRSEKLGLSQTDLARRTGMTRQTVCHYFSGARFSSIVTLRCTLSQRHSDARWMIYWRDTVMIILDEEHAKDMCDNYCRFPYTVEGDDL